MSTTTFDQTEVGAMLRIAGEVSELPQDQSVRRVHILDELLALLGGCSAVCSEIDPQHASCGWALPGSITCSSTVTADQQRLINRYVTGNLAALDPCVPYLLSSDKPVATIRRGDVVGRAWFCSEHFNEVRRPLGFGESLYGALKTPDGRRLKLSLHREMNDPPFEPRHAQLLQVFNENLGGLYVANSNEPVTRTDPRIESIPSRLRPVLRRLLAGDAEKQVARKLGLSPHTVHEYTKMLYREFNAHSRGELLAQFVTEVSA